MIRPDTVVRRSGSSLALWVIAELSSLQATTARFEYRIE